jgi:hypothetical protein
MASLLVSDPGVIDRLDQSQCAGISWDLVIPKLMKSFEGALIRRADVLL